MTNREHEAMNAIGDATDREHGRTGRTRRSAMAAALAAVALGAGCEVTNPGPVQDQFLSDRSSWEAMVNGARRQLLLGGNEIFYETSIVSREVMPGGNTGAYGFAVEILFGGLPWDIGGEDWNVVQQSRYNAENAIKRFVDEGAIPAAERPKSRVLAEAYIWAAYANRVLGEYTCEAVFDGGPAQSSTKHLERAQAQFTNALQIATAMANDNLKYAALGGRAQIRMWLKDWTGAVADAKQVPTTYVWMLPADDQAPNTRNAIYFGNAGAPYRSYSVWRTFFHTYYPETGDPRAAWETNPAFPFANSALPGWGQVPFVNQRKYREPAAGFPLAKGTEMRLIEAEGLLISGDWQGAMTIVNALRARYTSDTTKKPLEAYTATSLEDAWKYLKRERGIELWLEGRRLGDLRRWRENKTPGDLELPNFKAVSAQFKNEPDVCRPIPEDERVTNPNIPDAP